MLLAIQIIHDIFHVCFVHRVHGLTGFLSPGPSPVVDLKFTSITTNQMTITYEPPTKDAQCVKEIITRVIDESQKLRSKKSVKQVFEETFTGLQACTEYTIEVSTVSPSGLESLVERVRNTTLEDLPSAPQELGVNSVTTTSITLQWFQPAVNPGCVTEYTLSWTDSVDTQSATISDSNFKVVYTVANLLPCLSYEFTLVSESASGTSEATTFTQQTNC